MRDAFANYDAWLEAPYQRAAAEGEAAERFAEANDMPMESQADWDAIYDAMHDAEQCAAEDAAEARWEAQQDDWDERDEW
jgi:hypothetical protein